MSCEEHRFCEECRNWEGHINLAAVDIMAWAEAIQGLSSEARKAEECLDLEPRLAAIDAISTAIGIVCERDIEGETRGPRKSKPEALHPVPCGDTAS